MSTIAAFLVLARRAVGLLLFAAVAQAQPQFGPVDPDFAGVDQAARSYLAQHNLPGAAVVIAHGDRIIYAQGYGWADRELQVPMSPWHEFRLASVSKTLTATAVLKLVEQGRVDLDRTAWSYVSDFMAAEPADQRIKQITVRQLLVHSWGLDRSVSSDPMGSWVNDGGRIVNECKDMLRWRLLRMTLDFAPGTRYAYNNTGYCWLGFIAERIDGRPLDRQLTTLLGPEALSSGRVTMPSVLPSARTPAEVKPYEYVGAPMGMPVPGVYPAPAPAMVRRPDGNYTLTGYGGSGGLVASPLTITRFVQRLVGARQPALLAPAIWQQMRTPQNSGDGYPNNGLGIVTTQAYQDPNERWFSFNGMIMGTRTGWTSTPRFPGGPMVTIVAFVNANRTWPGDGMPDNNIIGELVSPLLQAVDAMGRNRYSAKPEIGSDRLIAWDSVTHDYFADLLLDWGQRSFPDLLKGTPQAGSFDGYRFRYYAATGTYIGMKQGSVFLYQPGVGPQIVPLGTMVDYLPQAMRDMTGIRAISAPGGTPSR